MKSIGNTSKLYTVVIQCCDPPVKAVYWHTKAEGRAKSIFNQLVAEEKKEGGGGEFSINLYKHRKPYPKVDNMVTTEDKESFVYYIHYPESEEIDSFSYMDLYKET